MGWVKSVAGRVNRALKVEFDYTWVPEVSQKAGFWLFFHNRTAEQGWTPCLAPFGLARLQRPTGPPPSLTPALHPAVQALDSPLRSGG